MKCNKWTLALIGAGLVSVPAVTQADEATNAVPSLLTSLSATTLSGYVDTSAHWNPGTGNNNLPTYAPNGVPGGAKADGFNLNVVNLTLSHPPGEGDWGAGYNATVLLGPDAVGYNNTFGLAAASDVSLKDAYVELRAPLGNGLDIKLGNFSEPLGYEVYETGNNPNYTRSYGYEIEPTQLTGVLASYTVSPMLSMTFGVANTWSAGLNARNFSPAAAPFGNKAESFKTYMGTVTFTAPTNTGFLAGSTLSGGVINGYDAFNGVEKTSLYVGSTVNTPINNLKVGVAYDYVMLDQNALGPGGAIENSGYQNALGLYASFQATEKLGLYGRAEYFSQSSYLSVNPTTGYTGMASSVYAITGTVQYDLWKNVLARLEFRWDHAEHGVAYGGSVANVGAPGFSPGLDNAFLFAANVIYKF